MRTLTRSTLTLLATTTLFWGSSRSSSAEEPAIPPELAGKVQVMKKGDRAASAGILLSREALLKILRDLEARAKAAEARAEKVERDADAQVAHEKRVAKAEVDGARALAAACEGDKVRRERIYEDALKRCPAPTAAWKWYLATGVGAVVAGGLCVGTVAATR
jgi:hypothetical protein